MRRGLVVLAIIVLVAGGGGLTWAIGHSNSGHGSSDANEQAYCDRISQNQQRISTVLGSTDSTALIENVDFLKSLAVNAPADVLPSWTTLTTAITTLQKAIAATGHPPADFAQGKRPAGLTKAQSEALADAADTLTSPSTLSAAEAIETEVRDVCQINLGL